MATASAGSDVRASSHLPQMVGRLTTSSLVCALLQGGFTTMTMANKGDGGTPVARKESSDHSTKAQTVDQDAGAVCGAEDIVPRDSGGVSCFACRRSKKLCSKEVPCSR